MPASPRDLRLDFFRGLALTLIFIDHIPENILGYFTLQGVAPYDAAEVFIFISGFTAALVYGRVLEESGAFYATAQVLRRAWQLYVAHIFLFVMFIAEVSYTVLTVNNPMYNEEMRIGSFLSQPHLAIIHGLLLQFQPAFLDILPLYIVLLLAFPLILIGFRQSVAAVLAGSLLLYGAVQTTGLSMPAYPPGRSWFFNPLAWQLLFAIGAALGYGEVRGRRWTPRARVLLPGAVVIVAAASAIKLSWTVHGLREALPALFVNELWPISKTNLSPARLIPFLALVLVVGMLVPREAGFFRYRASRQLILLGRHSLEVFCLGILLSALGHFILAEFDSGIAVQLAVNAAGVLAMWLTAAIADWYKSMARGSSARRPQRGGLEEHVEPIEVGEHKGIGG
ncbi:MAG TPA: OpgC domain-containing protein [Stellaceae bacterium]|nr:OpgC domain-containing protein [Stellaceae bacterium]